MFLIDFFFFMPCTLGNVQYPIERQYPPADAQSQDPKSSQSESRPYGVLNNMHEIVNLKRDAAFLLPFYPSLFFLSVFTVGLLHSSKKWAGTMTTPSIAGPSMQYRMTKDFESQGRHWHHLTRLQLYFWRPMLLIVLRVIPFQPHNINSGTSDS